MDIEGYKYNFDRAKDFEFIKNHKKESNQKLKVRITNDHAELRHSPSGVAGSIARTTQTYFSKDVLASSDAVYDLVSAELNDFLKSIEQLTEDADQGQSLQEIYRRAMGLQKEIEQVPEGIKHITSVYTEDNRLAKNLLGEAESSQEHALLMKRTLGGKCAAQEHNAVLETLDKEMTSDQKQVQMQATYRAKDALETVRGKYRADLEATDEGRIFLETLNKTIKRLDEQWKGLTKEAALENLLKREEPMKPQERQALKSEVDRWSSSHQSTLQLYALYFQLIERSKGQPFHRENAGQWEEIENAMRSVVKGMGQIEGTLSPLLNADAVTSENCHKIVDALVDLYQPDKPHIKQLLDGFKVISRHTQFLEEMHQKLMDQRTPEDKRSGNLAKFFDMRIYTPLLQISTRYPMISSELLKLSAGDKVLFEKVCLLEEQAKSFAQQMNQSG